MILKEGVAEDRRRSSYIHPLYSPDGTLITDDFPPTIFITAASPGCGLASR